MSAPASRTMRALFPRSSAIPRRYRSDTSRSRARPRRGSGNAGHLAVEVHRVVLQQLWREQVAVLDDTIACPQIQITWIFTAVVRTATGLSVNLLWLGPTAISAQW